MIAAPTTLPITIPAIAPLDRPLLELDATTPVVPLTPDTGEEEEEARAKRMSTAGTINEASPIPLAASSPDDSIVISRLQLDENIFDPTSRRSRRVEEDDEDTPLTQFPHYRESGLERHASVICLLLVIVEIIGGFLSNSIALLMDATRLFADVLHPVLFDRGRPGTWKKSEIMAMYMCAAFLFLITALFCFFASQRLYTQDYAIHPLMMLAFAVVGQTANCILLYIHYAKDWTQRRAAAPRARALSWQTAQRVAHTLNHTASIVVLLSAVLILAEKTWEWTDTVATYVGALLTLANLAATSGNVTNEWRKLKRRIDYEDLE